MHCLWCRMTGRHRRLWLPSVRPLSLPLAAVWLDAVTLATAWPTFLPSVDVWLPAQPALAALWPRRVQRAQPTFHAIPSCRNACGMVTVPSPRQRVAAGASSSWCARANDASRRSGCCRHHTACPTAEALPPSRPPEPPELPQPTIVGTPSLAKTRLRTIKTDLTPKLRLYGCRCLPSMDRRDFL